ncbi:type II toxin-antitoxin system ParD family antitoxin [Rhizobium sp. 2YAF20]|uniref:type II toxin-antitoxin system ParD family antitoxin n=1 Tax=Rhizobium sp. 2YAF20 TaxID=3233027 RepID=UPI003F987F8A
MSRRGPSKQVQSGSYRDADEVVRAGLRLLRKREAKVAELRELIKEGEDDFEAALYHTYDSAEEMLQDISRLEFGH